jgi:hypothetical protein
MAVLIDAKPILAGPQLNVKWIPGQLSPGVQAGGQMSPAEPGAPL